VGNRILVADDHTLVRQGVCSILKSIGFEVVAEASNGFEAVEKAREFAPDVAIMDLYMPGMDGIAATSVLRREFPNIRVIMLSASENEDDVVQAVSAGARGYVTKSAEMHDMAVQLRRVLAGGTALSDKMTEKLVAAVARGSRSLESPSDVYGSISQRERDVLRLITEGASNKAIAQKLCVSENTVRAHVRSLMQKLNVNNRTQIAVFGLRRGLGGTEREQFNGLPCKTGRLPANATPAGGLPARAGLDHAFGRPAPNMARPNVQANGFVPEPLRHAGTPQPPHS